MADIRVRSTDGDNADNGSTWPLAKADLSGAAAIEAGGDTIWLSQAHAESAAGALILNLAAGTVASPVRILCGNDAADPPTALATTATIATTGTGSIQLNGNLYGYGFTLSAGTLTGASSITLCGQAGNRQRLKNCNLVLGGTSASSLITVGAGATARECMGELIDCTIEFGATTQRIGTTGWFVIRGGSASAGGADPVNFVHPFFSAGEPCNVMVDGFDFTNWGSGLNLITGGGFTQAGSARFRNCKLPASWSGALWSTAPTTAGFRAELINCDSGDTNFRMWVEDYCGSIKDETTIVRTGGASDGATPIAWKMEASANAQFPLNILRSPEIFVWNDTVGAAVTVEVEIVHDSVTALDDDEAFIEGQYPGTSGFPLSLFLDDSVANVLATPAAQTSSSVAWTTTGMANPNKQKLALTFTPQEKGWLILTVCLALANKVIYVDPKGTVS